MSLLSEFEEFLSKNNVGATILATVMSTYITELGVSFSDNLILPIIDQDLDGDGKPDIGKLKNIVFNIGRCKLKVGQFLITFTKVILMFVIIFMIQRNILFSKNLFKK